MVRSFGMETCNDMPRNFSECLTLSFKDSWFGHGLKSRRGQPVFSKNLKNLLVLSIMKLSACIFGIHSVNVRMGAFSFAQSD
jgi:hypothetical protein